MTNEEQARRLGRYEIVKEIGRGGFATVYRARDTRMARQVALKVVHGNFAQDPGFVARFHQEVRTAANLRHPNVIPIYDSGDADGELYLAMPLIGEGRTLRDLIVERAPFAVEEAVPILAQVAEALSYLHGQAPPLVHRDVKPANVLLEGQGEGLSAVLTDFGLVRSMEASARSRAAARYWARQRTWPPSRRTRTSGGR